MLFSLKKNLPVLVFTAVFIFTVAVLLPIQQTSAVAGLPFGGSISNATLCTCSGFNYLLTISPPTPGSLVFQPGASQVFAFGQVFRPGPFVLGTYATGGVCLVGVPPFCSPLPSIGTIVMTGTSL